MECNDGEDDILVGLQVITCTCNAGEYVVCNSMLRGADVTVVTERLPWKSYCWFGPSLPLGRSKLPVAEGI